MGDLSVRRQASLVSVHNSLPAMQVRRANSHPRRPAVRRAQISCADDKGTLRERTVAGMFDDDVYGDATGSSWGGPKPELLTLALLEDVAAVLVRHGLPPLRGYALAELTASLYRLQLPYC
jgi:hypothetical protein